MNTLNLNDLKDGRFGVSKNIGPFLAEAALVCLDLNQHSPGTTLSLSGFSEESFILDWTDTVTPEISKSWKDLKEATEYGATAIAALLIFPISGLIIAGRVPQVEQSDYVLQSPDNYRNDANNPEAFLEVSGILNENVGNTINMRV